MKTVKQLLSEGKAASYSTAPTPSDRKVKAPPTLLWRRTSIRTFPDNHIVALYYSPQLDKYVSIPFGPEGKALTIDLTEAEQLDEFAWVPAAIAAARVAAPAIARGAVSAAGSVARGAGNLIPRGAKVLGRLQRSRLGAVGQNIITKAKRLLGIRRTPGQRARDLLKRRKLTGAVGGAAAVGALSGGGGGPIDDGPQPNKEHKFDADIGKRAVREPQSVMAGASPVTNYRQKQNQNYIWNTQSRAGQVNESLQRIIENKKSEVISGVKITPTVAKKLVNLHESLNTENKENFEKMFGDADSLRKVINFSLRK